MNIEWGTGEWNMGNAGNVLGNAENAWNGSGNAGNAGNESGNAGTWVMYWGMQ